MPQNTVEDTRPSLIPPSVSAPDKIANAVRICLAVCLPAESPLAQLLLYLEELRGDENWTDEEIREVDTRVRRLLMMFKDNER